MDKGILFKACRHCGGDLVLEADVREPERERADEVYVCLQCGRRFVRTAVGAAKQKAESPHKAA